MSSLLLSLTLAANLSCAPVLIRNRSSESWNDVDQKHYATALRRCPSLYKDSPCLKVFTKKAPRTYTAICGK